jgi:hypothetical protein
MAVRYTLLPRNSQYALYKKPGGPQGRSGRVRKISLPTGFDPQTVQPAPSRYIEYAIPAPFSNFIDFHFFL